MGLNSTIMGIALNEWASMLVCAGTIVCAVLLHVCRKQDKRRIAAHFTPLKALTSGVVLSIWLLIFLSQRITDLFSFAEAFMASILNTLKFFNFSLLPSGVPGVLGEHAALSAAGEYYAVFLIFLSKGITLAVAYAVLRDLVTQWIYTVFVRREMHIFSALNEKTICLAEDIARHKRRRAPIFIFTHVEDKYAGEFYERARMIRAHFTKKSILDFPIKNRRNFYYLMGADEEVNLREAVLLQRRLHQLRRSGDLNVVSSVPGAQEMADSIKTDPDVSVRLWQESCLIAYDLLFSHPMFRAAEKSGDGKMHVLVVGEGETCMEIARACMWCGRMQRYGFEICVLDTQSEPSAFESRCRTLTQQMRQIGVDLACTYQHVGAQSDDFVHALHAYAQANYIAVSMQSDNRTVQTALTVRRELVRAAVENGVYDETKLPEIFLVLKGEAYRSVFSGISAGLNLTPIGYDRDIYVQDYFSNSAIDRIAVQIHREYCRMQGEDVSDEEAARAYYQNTEQKKDSGRACALHALYKLKDAGFDVFPDAPDGAQPVTPQQVCERLRDFDMRRIEHERWSVFMYLQFWDAWALHSGDATYQSIEKNGTGEHRIAAAKLHGCLIPADDLPKLEDYVSRFRPEYGNGFLTESDQMLSYAGICALCRVLEDASFVSDSSEREHA